MYTEQDSLTSRMKQPKTDWHAIKIKQSIFLLIFSFFHIVFNLCFFSYPHLLFHCPLLLRQICFSSEVDLFTGLYNPTVSLLHRVQVASKKKKLNSRFEEVDLLSDRELCVTLDLPLVPVKWQKQNRLIFLANQYTWIFCCNIRLLSIIVL